MLSPVRFSGAEKIIFRDKQTRRLYQQPALGDVVSAWMDSHPYGFIGDDHFIRLTADEPRINPSSDLSDVDYFKRLLDIQDEEVEVILAVRKEFDGLEPVDGLLGVLKIPSPVEPQIDAFEARVHRHIERYKKPPITVLVSGEGKNLQFEEQVVR